MMKYTSPPSLLLLRLPPWEPRLCLLFLPEHVHQHQTGNYISGFFCHVSTFYLVCGCWQVPGEASETDSEEELDKASRAYATGQESTQILKKDLPPLIVLRDHPDIQSVVEDIPSPTHKPHGEYDFKLTRCICSDNEDVSNVKIKKIIFDYGLLISQLFILQVTPCYSRSCRSLTAVCTLTWDRWYGRFMAVPVGRYDAISDSVF